MKIVVGNTPEIDGMYIVYEDIFISIALRTFLTYYKGIWSYPGSGERYRGNIIAYMGPIPLRTVEELVGTSDVAYAIGPKIDKYSMGPFSTLNQALASIGGKGDFIFRIYEKKKAIKIRKWSEVKLDWIGKKKK